MADKFQDPTLMAKLCTISCWINFAKADFALRKINRSSKVKWEILVQITLLKDQNFRPLYANQKYSDDPELVIYLMCKSQKNHVLNFDI